MSTASAVGVREDYHLQERELQKRLPHVSVEVIRHFLLQYQGNIEVCYEILRPDPKYLSDTGRTSTISTSRPTTYHQPRENHRDVRRTLTWGRHPGSHSPSLYGDAPPNVAPYSMTPPSPAMATPTSLREPLTLTPQDIVAVDIVTAQRQQQESLHRYQEDLVTHISFQKAEVDQKKRKLTDLRVEVSADVSEQQLGELKDVISTLHIDIQEARNKLQVHKVQTQMKHEQDLYTEEGVRWFCKECTFLNHPLMTQCEKCEVPKQRSYNT